MGDSCDFGASEPVINWASILDRQNGIILDLEEKVFALNNWVNDLHSGMYINCVYCGHRYGPSDEVPSSMADVLKEHIEKCPKHPMSSLKSQIRFAVNRIDEGMVDYWKKDYSDHKSQIMTLKDTIEEVNIVFNLKIENTISEKNNILKVITLLNHALEVMNTHRRGGCDGFGENDVKKAIDLLKI